MSRTFALVLCLLFAAVGFAKSTEPRDPGKPQKSTTGAMLRSLVVPGWGQAYNDSWIKAGIFAVVEGLQISSISSYHDRMMAAKRFDAMPEQYEEDSADYFAALTLNSKANTDERRYREARNKNIWWFAATVLLSIGDAYVDAHLYGLDFSPDISFHNDARVGVVAAVRF